MCELYVKADPILYESRSRTVRIHGVLTSIAARRAAESSRSTIMENFTGSRDSGS